MEKGGYVYILTNKNHTTLYVGVTSNLERRIGEHLEGRHINSFTKRYNLNKLIYTEHFSDIKQAIAIEKRIKGWSRQKKEDLIAEQNPDWNDLFS